MKNLCYPWLIHHRLRSLRQRGQNHRFDHRDNFGFRYFDWELGRFVQRDPSGYPDGPNNYLYCHNNPINFIDPLGLEAIYRDEWTSEETSYIKKQDTYKPYDEKVTETKVRHTDRTVITEDGSWVQSHTSKTYTKIEQIKKKPTRPNLEEAVIAGTIKGFESSSPGEAKAFIDAVSTKEGRDRVLKSLENVINDPAEAAKNIVTGAITGTVDDIKDSAQHAKQAVAGVTDNEPVKAVYHSAYLSGKHGPDLILSAAGSAIFKTTKDATKAAKKLGYRKTKHVSHGQAVYTNGKNFISPDLDLHNGGVWEKAKTVDGLKSKSTRLGTYDQNLNKIGK